MAHTEHTHTAHRYDSHSSCFLKGGESVTFPQEKSQLLYSRKDVPKHTARNLSLKLSNYSHETHVQFRYWP